MKTYTVKSGDTLTKIAKANKCSVNDLLNYNKLKNPNSLFVGQVLNLTVNDIPATPLPKAPAPVKEPSWNFPVLPWRNYNNNVGKFLDQAYFRQIGAQHPGVDLNGNGGGNTDLGDLVYAISNGVVVDATFYPVWGNIVKIYHPHAKVWSVYAHLNDIRVRKGQQVAGRTVLGTIGRGAGNIYLAHLHFEIRTTDLPTAFWPSSTYGTGQNCINFIRNNYLDGVSFLKNKGAAVA